MRALMLYTASIQDEVALAEHAGDESDAHDLAVRLNDLLLPIVKGYGSEKSYELLGSQSLQTFGGSGYLQDYPLEQYIRDAKIDTLYEGTTAIQGMDFFFRKIVRDKGQALTKLMTDIQEFAKGDEGNGALQAERELLAKALEDVQGIVGTMVGSLTASAEEVTNIYKVGQNTTRLLLACGDLVVGLAAAAAGGRGGPGARGGRHRQGRGVLRGQGRRGVVLRPPGPAAAHRAEGRRRERRQLPHGPPRGRLLALAESPSCGAVRGDGQSGLGGDAIAPAVAALTDVDHVDVINRRR